MRIIRGNYRGKRINPPKNFKARPTTDFAKEGLFNILGNTVNFEEITVLDLFSGTGNISYEFLSRGCKNVTAVEIEQKHFNFIKKMGEELFSSHINVIKADALHFIKKRPLNFDLIFADPPYNLKEIDNIPGYIFGNETIKEETILIIEHSAETKFDKNQHFKQSRKYGNVNFSFFSVSDI